jgi:hypothetical protein
MHKLEGFTSQTPTPLNRPPIPLSEHQNFVDFSNCLENSQNFSEDGKWPKKCEFFKIGVLSWPNSGLSG